MKSAKQWIDEYKAQDPDVANDFRTLDQVVASAQRDAIESFARECAAKLRSGDSREFASGGVWENGYTAGVQMSAAIVEALAKEVTR